jgi:hypothetical protein
MVSKIAWVAMGMTIILLCSCSRADVMNECTENSNIVSETSVESNEIADYEEIDVPVATPPNYPQDEQSVIDPICLFWCGSVCVMLYIDGEYILRCDIRQKYTFIFYCDINRWTDEWDGIIIGNWWGGDPEDTRPSRGLSSDETLGLFVFQNDRIIIEEDDGQMIYGAYGIPEPRRFARELTTTQWDDWGVQIFQYAGDVTLIGMQGTLSQMPELHEDGFAHRIFICEEQTVGREILYIFYHELPESQLWNFLMPNP